MYPCIDIVNEGRILKFHSILYFRDVCGYSLSSNNLPHKTIIMIESVIFYNPLLILILQGHHKSMAQNIIVMIIDI